uniref:Integrase core domain containing protein n=1 Tax=Solanum tuberosum TaxID=4113 RepID=M1E168_SOLTU
MNNQGVPVNPIEGELGDGVGLQPPRVGDENNQIQAENLLTDAVRVHDQPGPILHDNYRVNFNAAKSDGPLVLPPLPPGHTFVVTCNFDANAYCEGLVCGFGIERSTCARNQAKECLQKVVWVDQTLTWMPLDLSKKVNHKDKLNNFVTLLGEFVSSSWDGFTAFIRGVSNHRTDDESLKQYFYQGQDVNSKAVFHTIAGGSYDEIREEMAKMRTKLGLVLKHMGGFQTNAQGSNSDNWCQGQGNHGRNYGNYNREGNYVWDRNYNRANNYNWNNYGNINERVRPYVPPENRESGNREDGGSMSRIEEMMQKMLKKFDTTDQNVKEMPMQCR